MIFGNFYCNENIRKLGPVSALAVALSLGLTTNAKAQEENENQEAEKNTIQLGKLTISGGLTTYLQATDGAPENATDLTYTMDLGLSASVSEHGKVEIALEAGDGRGVDTVLGSLSTANYDAFYTNLQDIQAGSDAYTNTVVPSVSQAYYEGEYMDGGLVFDIGKLDIHASYDDNAYANDETDQFMSAIFTRTAGTGYAELDRYYAPGLIVKFSPVKVIELTAIAANGNGDGFDNVFDYIYAVGQINFKPSLGGRDGNYRFYGIYDDRQGAYHEIDNGSITSNTAWGLSFDQSVAEGVGLFARYSYQDDGIAENIVDSTWSLGALVEGTLWGRERDTVGIGYGSVNLNGKADPATALGFSDTGDESHIEAFYKFGVTEYMTLTADVQVINNNGGNGSADAVTVAGIRSQLSF